MKFTELESERARKVERLRNRGIEPYPARIERTHTNKGALEAFRTSETQEKPIEATVVGRVVFIRHMGKASFANMEDGTGRLQIYLKKEKIGDVAYDFFLKDLDLGDFVQASGHMFRTKTGEPTLALKSLVLISKAITPPPEKYHGLTNVETRRRQRYADLMVNPEAREVFRVRTKIINAIRRFFDDLDFIEVETPVLQPIYGGAAAKPFTTRHNQLGQDLYLRISFELYLKRLLVGMYERVYEIGRDFRNEGVDTTHNPEFTMLEYYAAYWDYNKVMDTTEELLRHVSLKAIGTTKITYGGETIDLDGKWERMTLRDAVKREAGIDYADYPDVESLRKKIVSIGGKAPEGASWGKLIDMLIGAYVEPKLIQPTFIYDYPRDLSPLAKCKVEDHSHVERFEFFIAGMEMGNAFSELNDPVEQQERFVEMGRAINMEEGEAHPLDEDYLRAMRYGMPPNAGFGMGVDRLTMLLTDRKSIRDVIMFPHLKRIEENSERPGLNDPALPLP